MNTATLTSERLRCGRVVLRGIVLFSTPLCCLLHGIMQPGAGERGLGCTSCGLVWANPSRASRLCFRGRPPAQPACTQAF